MKPVLAVMYREYLIRRTSLMWMFFDVIVPLLYLLLFGVAFDRAFGTSFIIDGMPVRYNDFFLAGVLAMTCFGNAVNQTYGFFVDRDNGIFFEHLTYPLTRGQLLFGKILFQGIMTIAQTITTLTAAELILEVHIQIVMIPLIFLAVVIGTAGWFFSLSNVAFLIRRNDTFNLVINASYFILMFMSSLFYPIDQVPVWLRVPSLANPLTWHANILRYLTIGTGSSMEIALQSLLFLGFLFISFKIAVHTIQRSA
ncbi:MAG: ABC transporter permease [Bacteroidetes bacterium]|nr:ABC transporter permease [Bacteroidota bacterium]